MAGSRMTGFVLVGVLGSLVALAGGCGRTEDPPTPKPVDIVVVNYHDWLKDGGAVSWALTPGRYKVELTASEDGVSVVWEGSNCPGSSSATKSFSVICDMPQAGQLIVKNPTTFGTGPSSSVTVQVTKLAQ